MALWLQHTFAMVDMWEADEELARLESMHDRVEKLRSTLKQLEIRAYCAIEEAPPVPEEPANTAHDVSKKYT